MPCGEENENVFSNEMFSSSLCETNSLNEIIPQKNMQTKNVLSNKSHNKLISSFVFLCAAVVMLNVGVYIPVFSEIFTPLFSSQKPSNSQFVFSYVGATESKIDITLMVEGVKLDEENYFLYLVLEDNASNEFVGSVSEKAKFGNQIKITTNTFSHSFTKFMSSSGDVNLKPNTKYAVLIVKDDEIIEKTSVSTKIMIYVTEVKTNPVYLEYLPKYDKYIKHLGIVYNLNEKFEDYTNIWFVITNTTTKAIDFANIAKGIGGTPDFSCDNEAGTYLYQLKIYCLTDHLESLDYDETQDIIINEETGHLIYTHDKLIEF